MRILTRSLCLLFAAMCGSCVLVDDGATPLPDTGEATQLVARAVAGSRPGAPVSSGTWLTCAARHDGTVWCWGKGTSGQLGDGNATNSNTPVQVAGLTGVSGVTAGSTHACALAAGGSVWCWGENNVGQLGDGTTVNRTTPVPVPLSDIVAIQAGGDHTCALDFAGAMWCWGFNASGQLGDGTRTTRLTPVPVQNLPGIATRMAAGTYHSCATLADGTAWCWGANDYGMLGDGTTTHRPYPTAVASMVHVKDIAASMLTTCALQASGRVSCWGLNDGGQVGDGTFINRVVPTELSLTHVTQIAMGANHACARLVDGTARCWGRNWQGQLGDGTTTDRNAPVTVAGLDRATTLAPGAAHTCALIADGTVKCWGWNQFGQLGDGTNTSRLAPAPVLGLAGIRRDPRIASGGTYTCALRPNGSVRCWGQNNSGQLGVGGSPAPQYLSTPADVVGLADALDVSAGYSHTCALLAGGTVKCWGQNTYYMLGDGTQTQRNTPVSVLGLDSVITVAPGSYHTCALIADGTVKCWGNNSDGQLGDGTITTRQAPQPVPGLENVVALSAGANHTCAVLANGTGRCWGRNDQGMLGDGTYVHPRLSPVAVSGLTNAVAIAAAGTWSSCALIADGGVRCWGGNNNGQLGTGGTAPNSNVPVAVAGLDDAVALESSTHGDTICAIRSDGAAACWGYNQEGQCGNGASGTFRKEPVPVPVTGLDGIAGIAPGLQHTCALDTSGEAWCWGSNGWGQIGTGSIHSYPPVLTPQPVINFP